MAGIKDELITLLNKALELEHAARVQYLSHAELIVGLSGEEVINRLNEIAKDEEKHESMFRNLIGNYLGGVPSMGISETHSATDTDQILEVNIKDEKSAIDFYKQVYKKVMDNKDKLQYEFETLEHDIRHVIVDEQEHVVELSLLACKKPTVAAVTR